MRTSVILSALFLVAGFLLEIMGEAIPVAVATAHLGMFFMLAAATLLVLTFLASLLPGTAKRLRECQH